MRKRLENRSAVGRFLVRKQDSVFLGVTVFVGVLLLSTIALAVRCIVDGGCGFETVLGIVLNALVAALGFLAIYASVQTDKEIKKFEYIADYNFNFLANPEFSRVERMLETCNQKYERLSAECGGTWTEDEASEFMAFCDGVFGSSSYAMSDDPDAANTRIDGSGFISEDYQGIVNYLVYLESFVPLINRGQIAFEEVDDLFGYRYFIAVNNPVLQLNELCRERVYYSGIFEAYESWFAYRGGNVPMKNYSLKEAWDEYKADHPGAAE